MIYVNFSTDWVFYWTKEEMESRRLPGCEERMHSGISASFPEHVPNIVLNKEKLQLVIHIFGNQKT